MLLKVKKEAAVILCLAHLARAEQQSPPSSVPLLDSNVGATPTNVLTNA
jgi:hypothetical protein